MDVPEFQGTLEKVLAKFGSRNYARLESQAPRRQRCGEKWGFIQRICIFSMGSLG